MSKMWLVGFRKASGNLNIIERENTSTIAKSVTSSAERQNVTDKVQQPDCIGVRFDIGKIDSGGYGEACWQVFWQSVATEIVIGAQLVDGDTNDTPDRENVYCLAVKWISSGGRGDDVRKALEQSDDYLKVAAYPKFIDAAQVRREPLVDDGRVDQSGNIVGTSYRALPALEKVRKEQQKSKQEPAKELINTDRVNTTDISKQENGTCPKCSASLEVLPNRSSVSSYIKDYACTKCSWTAPKCGNKNCCGYMIGTATPIGYSWKCVLCEWSGTGNIFMPQR